MPLDYSPEPLGFRGLGVTPLPDKTTAPTIEGLRDTDYVTDAPGQDEPRDKPTLWEDLGTLATGVGTALTMKGSFAQAARRQREGQPFFTDAQRRLVDVGGAAMRQENWIVGLRQHAPDFGDVDPEHNPIAELWGTPLAVYWPYFIGSRNASETEWLRQKLDRELKDRQTLEENPITGAVLSMGAALLSPTTLLPGGALFHGATGSTKLIAMAKSFAAVGSANAIAAGIDEYILHRQQMARTGLESTFAVGGALLLGGAFGATLSRMGSKRAGRLLEALEKEIHVPARSEDDPFGIGGLNTARGVGAEVTDAKPPVQLEGTGIGIERWMRFQDPVLRTLNNPIRSAREAGTQLFETVLGVTRNAEGFTTAPVGGAVETRIKTQGHARLGEAMRQTDELFADYYFGKTDARLAAARSQVNRWMGDQRLSFKKFKEEVGRALNRNDEHPIPQVAAVAKLWRKVLIDPIADAAVKLKMLDAEQVARGRPKGSGGAAPSGGTPSPQTPRGPGPGGTGGDASPEFPFDIQRMRQLEVNLQELQNSLGLPPMDQALRDAFLQRIGKALEDVTVDPATRALVDILEGRAPRAEIDPALAKQLREALQAQRAAEGAPTAADLQKAASAALERLDEVLPEGFGPKAMKMLDDAFQGKMPSVDEIVDLFRPKVAEVEISPVSPFRIRENAIKGEVEAIVDMWRMVATVPRNPPEGLVSWLVRSGGVVDAQGDIAAMLGATNKRPGLLRKPGGPQLDDVALRAWEEGFLPGELLPDGTPGRPTINQLLDAIRDDLSAGHPAERVIRAADREAMDLWLQAGEMRRELRDMGISSRMSEGSVEKLARKFATERYDSGVDGPASAALAAHSGSVLRVIDRMMETGKTWTLPYASHQKIKEALGDTVKRAADDTVVGAVERLEPIGWMTWNGKRTPKVEVTFRTFDDELVNVVLPWGQARQLRAAHFPAGSIPGRDGRAVVFFRTTLGSDIQLRKTLGGELVHELVHNQVRDLGVSHVTRPLWDRLVRHAESLRILEMDQKQYMAAISHPSASMKLDDVTMRQKYEEQYRGRPDIDQAIREESVAHLFELRHHGQLMKSEIEPIADILQAFDRNDLKSQSVLDELLAAEQARLADESAAIDARYAEMRAASEQPMFALAGAAARTADQGALAKAQAMRKMRHSPEQVWRQTGWFQGEDGKWRFEIDDRQMAVKDEAKAAFRWDFDPDDTVDGVPTRYRGDWNGTLGDLIEHKALFDAYPDLQSVPVDVGFGGYYGTRGAYDRDGNTLTINVNDVEDWDTLQDILLHEVQHLVQTRERFAAGSNPSLVADANTVVLERVVAEIAQTERAGVGGNRLPVLQAAKEALERSAVFMRPDFWGAGVGSAAAYRNVMGEVEARNVVSRRRMTPDERQASFPRSTEDVPAGQQLRAGQPAEVTIPPEQMVVLREVVADVEKETGVRIKSPEALWAEWAKDGYDSALDIAQQRVETHASRLADRAKRLRGHDVAALRDFDFDRALSEAKQEIEAAYTKASTRLLSPASRRLKKALSGGTAESIAERLIDADPALERAIREHPKLDSALEAYRSVNDKRPLQYTVKSFDESQRELAQADGALRVLSKLRERGVDLDVGVRPIGGLSDIMQDGPMFALGPVKRWLGWQRPVDGALNRGGADAGQSFGAPARISREQFLSMAKRLPKKARAVGDVSVLASVSGDYVEYFVVPKGQRSPWGKDGFLSNPLGSFTVGRGQNGGIEITNASLADDMQRRGIGSAVYDLVERDFPGFTLMPSPWNQLSEAAVQFWAKRAPQKLAYQRRRAAQDLGGDLYPERVIPGEQPMFALGPTDRKTRPNFTQRLYERIREEVADDLTKPKPKAGEDPPTFDPETGRAIFDDEGQTYVTRLYNREKIIAERQQFRDILIAHFAAGQKRADGLLKSITDDIKAGRRAPDAKTEQQIEQLREFTGLEQQELRGVADDVINHILGSAEGRMVYDLPPAVRGPLKARTLRIRDELIEDYLDRDIERIGRFYMRTMVPDIEMTRMFGSLDMKEQIAKIRDEAVALADANPKLNKQIHAAADRAVKDLTAIADRMRGTYMLPEDPTALLPRIGSVVRTLNYLRLLGGMTISALPDTARIVMTHGFVATYRDGLMPLITNLQAVKAAGREVKLAGTALDMILDTRAMAMADVLDDFGRYSKFERGLQKAQEHFGVMSLMAPWNAAMKQWTGMIVMSNILREGERLLMGKPLSKAALRRLAASNIDEDTLRIIAEQWKKHGDKNGSVYLPNSTAWDVDSPRVQLALEAFRGAIVRDVDRIVVTVGQDKPLWMSTQIGKIVGQFKSFGVASVQRTLIAGLQERDAGVAMGFAMAIGLGAVVEALKNQISGKKNPESMKQWVVNAIDKSGLTGWLFDVNHFTERFTGGVVGLSALTGRPVSRYASRNWADAIGGPSAGLLKDLAGSNASLFRWAFNGEKPTEADVRALRRTVPLQNLFYIAWLFRELEEGTAKAIGARPSPKRN